MNVTHNSFLTDYRSPFGAQPAGQRVRLRLLVEPDAQDAASDPHVSGVYLHYAYGLSDFQTGCKRMRALPEGQTWYETFLDLPQQACLLFYWFELAYVDRPHQFYAKPFTLSHTGGLQDNPPDYGPESTRTPWPFQITVYEPHFDTPHWWKGATVYQIFPDRFARATDFDYEAVRALKTGPEYRFHEAWTEEVDFEGQTSEGYLACDFYGGSLRGILEHLDDLERLNVEVIYLNPIAQARSNHRYDTGDYFKVDPVLGDLADFKALCEAAKRRGMRVILDGVYSHTGADSVYFNREGRYPGIGAYQELLGQGPSPYRDWYELGYEQDKIIYDSWWGFPDLPVLRKQNLDYQAFITGPEGVLAHWLRAGASGFRLDVADELPEAFLYALRARVKAVDPEAVILGEVWEEASNKVSYGHYRDFVLGHSLDCVMNYPLAHAVVGYVSGELSAPALVAQLENQQELLPPCVFHAQLNLLGSHDISRVLNRVLSIPDPGTRVLQSQVHLTEALRNQGLSRVQLAFLLTFFLPGCPTIYYGDERGMEGFRDPFNRRPMRWDLKPQLLEAVETLSKLRKAHPVLRLGDLRCLYAKDQRLILLRHAHQGRDVFGQPLTGPQDALLAVNLSEEPWDFTHCPAWPYPKRTTTTPLKPQSACLRLATSEYLWEPFA